MKTTVTKQISKSGGNFIFCYAPGYDISFDFFLVGGILETSIYPHHNNP